MKLMIPFWKIDDLRKKVRHTAIKVVTSEPVRELRSWPGMYSYRKALRHSANGIVVDVSGRMGMGALISKALLFYALAEREGFNLTVVSSCPLYASQPNEDVFSTFFDRATISAAAVRLDNLACRWAMRHANPKCLGLAQAAALYSHHFKPGTQLLMTVSSICKSFGPFDLSIHYRGTDKVLESGEVPYELIVQKIENYIINNDVRNVFLATDDQNFEIFLKHKFANIVFVTFNLGAVDPAVPRHFSDLQPHDKALEALVNCYVIASTPVCIRTSSYLSSLSKIVNPGLQTITVNRTKAKRFMFPEDVVLGCE